MLFMSTWRLHRYFTNCYIFYYFIVSYDTYVILCHMMPYSLNVIKVWHSICSTPKNAAHVFIYIFRYFKTFLKISFIERKCCLWRIWHYPCHDKQLWRMYHGGCKGNITTVFYTPIHIFIHRHIMFLPMGGHLGGHIYI